MTYRDKEGRNDLVMTEGGTDKDKEGQTRTMRVVMNCVDRRRDRQGQRGTYRDKEIQTRTRRVLITW